VPATSGMMAGVLRHTTGKSMCAPDAMGTTGGHSVALESRQKRTAVGMAITEASL